MTSEARRLAHSDRVAQHHHVHAARRSTADVGMGALVAGGTPGYRAAIMATAHELAAWVGGWRVITAGRSVRGSVSPRRTLGFTEGRQGSYTGAWRTRGSGASSMGAGRGRLRATADVGQRGADLGAPHYTFCSAHR